MALAARPMYAKNLLPGNLGVAAAPGALPQPPPAGALTDIENFSLMIAILMPQVTAADHGINFDSTQNLLELLAWLSGVVFPNALARYPAADQGQAAWINANNAANNLGLLTNSTAALGPYVLNGAAANAPAETPLELVYETVLQGLPAVNFGMLIVNCFSTFIIVCVTAAMRNSKQCPSISLSIHQSYFSPSALFSCSIRVDVKIASSCRMGCPQQCSSPW